MGNEVIAQAAKDAGAKLMFGYPITPSTEIFESWVKMSEEDKNLNYLQTEDEMAAGFAMIGACLAGVPAFTATAGPGNVLMQDALSMAEALRSPTVTIITQRGGLSTSTVIYSQEEVTLTCFGGNGEGFRLVYSTANLQELYDYTLKAFRHAWLYRFPTFILSDGYQAKTKGAVNIEKGNHRLDNVQPILKEGTNFRNCYNLEEEIGTIILSYADEYRKIRPEVEEAQEYQTKDAKTIIIAHGIVAAAANVSVDILRKNHLKVGLFRPVTLRPFPTNKALKAVKKANQIIVIESALGQLSRIIKDEMYGISLPLIEMFKPAVGFTPEEISQNIKEIIK